ncbi:hypothetical protein P643_01 [Klebsiella phage QL]|uniref:Uncharacterized protein n=1 Tax=Klebsiella phage QL TaxID=3062018 RepID=A0AAX4ASP7_9CAUD|nr:hypothetical protein P643_01 [Klebsiella phage QL]
MLAIVGTGVAPGVSLGLARLYLNPKFIILTRAPPSPSTRPIAPIGVPSVNLGGGGGMLGPTSGHQRACAAF